MKIISHRGNLSGDSTVENTYLSITRAIEWGFDVEIDVWTSNGSILLGHNGPEHPIDLEFLIEKKEHLWCHAKTLAALELLLTNGITCFWHENDRYTLTSNGYIWTFPECLFGSNSIVCILGPINRELHSDLLSRAYGVCTDYPIQARDLLK